MGAFVVNFHVRNDDSNVVRQRVAECGARQFRVSNPKRGWISIYEEQASEQDEVWIEKLGGELSTRLGTACVAFMLHDSDIARYWLHDQGTLLDEYNSVPDYFDDISPAERKRLRGKPDVFVRYCKPGVTSSQINSVLRADVTFADDTISQLAEFLGIDPERALEDFRDADDDSGGGWRADNDDHGWDGDDEDEEPSLAKRSVGGGLLQKVQQQIASMFASVDDVASSPLNNELVQAAAEGNVTEMERLIAEGADVNGVGTMPVSPAAPVDVLPIGNLPRLKLSPLLAAASKGQVEAVRLLVDVGAKTTEVHPIVGSPLHASVQAGSTDVTQLLIEAGVSANIQNAQGQTPLQLLQALRQNIELTKNMVQSMPQLKGVYDQFLSRLAQLEIPFAGWEACESLLRKAGGR